MSPQAQIEWRERKRIASLQSRTMHKTSPRLSRRGLMCYILHNITLLRTDIEQYSTSPHRARKREITDNGEKEQELQII